MSRSAAFFLVCLGLLCAQPASRALAQPAPIVWQTLLPGLELSTVTHSDPDTVRVTVLRIDPGRYAFSLHSVLEEEHDQALSIGRWAESQDLSAAVNACMFLPDGRSPAAYLRQGEESQRSVVAKLYGGFFVSGPRRPGLPQAAVLDKDLHDWETLLPQYDLVVQNMRLLGADGRQLWPEDGPRHSTAAIGQDRDGNILFLHCRDQVNVRRLARALLAHKDLKLQSAVYVEGGGQSSLALRTPALSRVWTGKSAVGLLLGQDMAYPLPSVIGVRPRVADGRE